MKRLFVGNLPYSATEHELQDWFTGTGAPVEGVTIVRDRFSGESRGFGFADVSDEEIERVVAAANGQSFNGRALVVNEARPMADRNGGGGGGGGERRGGQRNRY